MPQGGGPGTVETVSFGLFMSVLPRARSRGESRGGALRVAGAIPGIVVWFMAVLAVVTSGVVALRASKLHQRVIDLEQRSTTIESIQQHLALLDDNSARLESRIHQLDVRISNLEAMPTSDERVPQASAVSTEYAQPVAAPGSLLIRDDQLSPSERAYFAENPPPPGGHIVRGESGRVGVLLATYVDETGELAYATTVDAEELASALLGLSAAKTAAIGRLLDAGDVEWFDESGAAEKRGRELGAYSLIPGERGFAVIDGRKLKVDPEVADATQWIEEIKARLGKNASYAVSWFSPPGEERGDE